MFRLDHSLMVVKIAKVNLWKSFVFWRFRQKWSWDWHSKSCVTMQFDAFNFFFFLSERIDNKKKPRPSQVWERFTTSLQKAAYSIRIRLLPYVRELKKTTTATATSLNKRFNEQNNSCARVRYKSLYISLPSSAKQQREMTKFCVAWRTFFFLIDVVLGVAVLVS